MTPTPFPRILSVVQARLGSSRLPGKVLLPLLDHTVLFHQVARLRRARLAGQVVVAIPTGPADDPLADYCAHHELPCFRGHPTDLLDRHYQAARHYQADLVLKIPSDCPLIDPAVIDRTVQHSLDHAADYDFVSNLHPATYPDGNDVEVIPLASLKRAWQEATRPLEREHTTPYFWDTGLFRVGNVAWETGLDCAMSHRFTLDYREDYDFIRAVYQALYPTNPAFSLADILALLDQRPDIYQLNAQFAGVNWYRHHLDELRTVDARQTRPQ